MEINTTLLNVLNTLTTSDDDVYEEYLRDTLIKQKLLNNKEQTK